MFTIEHDFDATVVTLVDEGRGHLNEDVIVNAFEDCVTVEQVNPRTDKVEAITLSMTQLQDLRAAIDNDELELEYQPKILVSDETVCGFEALVRWELPERGLILPSDFIPIAEETSLIIEIGEWVLDKVCQDFRFWKRSGITPDRVSVNLSLRQLRQEDFSSRISSMLKDYKLSPTLLELEITESTLMEDPEHTIKILDQLFSLGLHLAIDDFGTGHSSLAWIKNLPVDELKIDRSFVRDVTEDANDAALVETIMTMARHIGLEVVAEGVESAEVMHYLSERGCPVFQGYHLGRPCSAEDLTADLLRAAEAGQDHSLLPRVV